MPSYPPSRAFFQDAIKEIYNNDAPIPIHLKIYMIHFGVWPAIQGIFGCDVPSSVVCIYGFVAL